MDYHIPVLLNECIHGLNINKEGTYVDVTFGGGGHTKEILKQITKGKVLGFDQDSDAAIMAEKIEDKNFKFIKSNFRYLDRYLKLHGIKQVDGILADLGVSSWQLDVAERGFSTRFAGDLDMRMGRDQALSAKEIVNGYAEKDLQQLFSEYGEVRNARTLAAVITTARINSQITTTSQLIKVIRPIAPVKKENKYLAQVFQALRIGVNDEINALKEFLLKSSELISKGGRLVVISYHSLEDRLVKNYIRTGKITGEAEKDIFGNVLRPFKRVNKKLITPSVTEIESNPRSRSAKLRIGEKI